MIFHTSRGVFTSHFWTGEQRKRWIRIHGILKGTNGKLRRWTRCTVHMGICIPAVDIKPCVTPDSFTGESACSIKDEYFHENGKTRAFGRAIEEAFPGGAGSANRIFRQELWHMYIDKFGLPRRSKPVKPTISFVLLQDVVALAIRKPRNGTVMIPVMLSSGESSKD